MLANNDNHPKAPTDPVKKRSCLYVMMDTIIEATPRMGSKPSQEIYLDNHRLKGKVKVTSDFEDEEVLKLLDQCEGFHKLVHSIGVIVKSDSNPNGSVNFVMNCLGKVDVYGTGTVISKECPLDGAEQILTLSDYQWSEEDNVIGKFAFEFENPGDIATATVIFYLQDGFDVPEIIAEPAVDFDSAEYKEMIAKSLLHKGNNQRIKKAIEKARRGEDVTLAYIGGSITQGAGAKPINTKCYAYQSYLKFKELYGKDGGDNVHFVKAGVGGTPSELGMIRFDRDVLKDGTVEPDLLIVEFAVNDAGDETKGDCYESLCLKALKLPNKPGVILLFSVFIDDYNLQDRLIPVGMQYDLPMVSVKNAVIEQFRLSKGKGNVISKKQYFYDIYHPTNDGHMVMADSIVHLIQTVEKDDMDEHDLDLNKEPAIGNTFVNVHLIDRKDNIQWVEVEEGSFSAKDEELQAVEMDVDIELTPQFPHNWMHTEDSGNESFKLKITSKSLLIVFKDSGSQNFGKAEVYVDGKLTKTLDPHEVNWTHCSPVILYTEDTARAHEIEVKMAPGDENKRFTILGFGYTR